MFGQMNRADLCQDTVLFLCKKHQEDEIKAKLMPRKHGNCKNRDAHQSGFVSYLSSLPQACSQTLS